MLTRGKVLQKTNVHYVQSCQFVTWEKRVLRYLNTRSMAEPVIVRSVIDRSLFHYDIGDLFEFNRVTRLHLEKNLFSEVFRIRVENVCVTFILTDFSGRTLARHHKDILKTVMI